MGLIVHEANLQDRDGTPIVLKPVPHSHPWLRHVFAGAGYAGCKSTEVPAKFGRFILDLVRCDSKTKGFDVLPGRCVAKRALAWLNRNQTLAQDFEKSVHSAETWIFLASIRLLSHRRARA